MNKLDFAHRLAVKMYGASDKSVRAIPSIMRMNKEDVEQL
jgi:hypothetical protein